MNSEETKAMVLDTMKGAMRIMVNNVIIFGSTDQCWNKSKAQIMDEFGMTEKGAVLMMRGAMSIINNELHPCFK